MTIQHLVLNDKKNLKIMELGNNIALEIHKHKNYNDATVNDYC